MQNNLELIKDLRERTGAGFLDCKKALIDSNNDIVKAIEFLRKKGLSKANKKSSRETKEGVIVVNINDRIGTMLEINTETDFVAKNNEFIKFVKDVTLNLNKVNSLDELLNFDDQKVKNLLLSIIAKIGENITIKRFAKLIAENDSKLFSYVHNTYDNNIGKIGCLLLIKSPKFDDELNKLSKNICMHISATKPIASKIEDLNNKFIEKEKEIIRENINTSGKSDEIIEKILNGKLEKNFEEMILHEQKFIMDNETKIKDVLINYSKNHSFLPKIIKYELFILGN